MRSVVFLVIVLAVALALWLGQDYLSPGPSEPGATQSSGESSDPAATKQQMEQVADAVAKAVGEVLTQQSSSSTASATGGGEGITTTGSGSTTDSGSSGSGTSDPTTSMTTTDDDQGATGSSSGATAAGDGGTPTAVGASGNDAGADATSATAAAGATTTGATAPPAATSREVARAVADAVSKAVDRVEAGAPAKEVAAEVAMAVAEVVAGGELAADPEAVGRAVAAAVDATVPGSNTAQVAQDVAVAVLERQAETFVEKISAPAPTPINPKQADHFVTQGQIVSLLPEASIETVDASALLDQPDLPPDTPITVVRTVEQVELATPERLIAEAAGDLDVSIRIVEGETVTELTVREMLERFASQPKSSINRLKNVRYFEVTTPAELAASSDLDESESLQIIREPYRLEAATIADILRREMELSPDSIFYVRTVRPGDDQGIWGIVQDGLIGNFARGMAIRHGREEDTYRVEIPHDADEVEQNRRSSFLGKLIHAKSLASHVYNFKENRMGQNPDQILPGQEIVIINFKAEELISIYKHFIEGDG